MQLVFGALGAAAAALVPTQLADDFRLTAISRVPLGTLARHQRPTADRADDVITRGNPPSAGPLGRCTFVVRNRCDRCRCRPLGRKRFRLMRLTILLHAIRTRLCCSLRKLSVRHRPQPFRALCKGRTGGRGEAPKRAGQTRTLPSPDTSSTNITSALLTIPRIHNRASAARVGDPLAAGGPFRYRIASGAVSSVDLHGQRVTYHRLGQGPAIVLIHGITSSSRTWRSVMDGLAEQHTVIAPDLLGHGRSGKPRGDYSLGAHASGVRDLLGVLGISQGDRRRAFAGRRHRDAVRLPVPRSPRAAGAGR